MSKPDNLERCPHGWYDRSACEICNLIKQRDELVSFVKAVANGDDEENEWHSVDLWFEVREKAKALLSKWEGKK